MTGPGPAEKKDTDMHRTSGLCGVLQGDTVRFPPAFYKKTKAPRSDAVCIQPGHFCLEKEDR